MTAVIVHHSVNAKSIIKNFLILFQEIPPENALPQCHITVHQIPFTICLNLLLKNRKKC